MTEDNRYAVVWFEGDDIFRLATNDDKTVWLTRAETEYEVIGVLETQSQVDEAKEGIRYAIAADLMDSMFGLTE